MALNRGKRKRRTRRRWDGAYAAPEPAEREPSARSKTAKPGTRTRGRKPLAERSPLWPTFIAGFCLLAAIVTIFVYRPVHQVARHHGHHVTYATVTGNPSGFSILVSILYFCLAGVEGFIAYRIVKARAAAGELTPMCSQYLIVTLLTKAWEA